MRSLYLRIWLTVVASLALFALVTGWLVQRQLDDQRERAEAAIQDRASAWAELLQRTLPAADAPAAQQQQILGEWSERLRVPMALDDAVGKRIAASESFVRRDLDRPEVAARMLSIRLDDGRTLWVPRPWPRRMMAGGNPGAQRETGIRPGAVHAERPGGWALPGLLPPWLPDSVGLALLLLLMFVAVAAGALHQRVAEDGRDEVAAVAASFNRAASRIEALLRSHQSLLANASHELRSPLARLKMAVAMIEEAAPGQRAALRREIDTNVAELDALVEEVLLTSRLDAAAALDVHEPVALLAVAAEEAARVGASAHGDDLRALGDERLLRRAVRNLLENARRYGGAEVEAVVSRSPDPGGRVELRVCDRGPGVPEDYRERIFEAFFRLPGHAEREGGVGLGLSLVRQIAERHGGTVRCEPRQGGGTCFVLALPAAAAA